MQRINLQTSQLLTWVQPKAFSRYWELRQNDQIVGTLQWTATFGFSAAMEFADGRWHLRQPGFFKSDIHIIQQGTEVDEATAKLRWRGNGSVAFTDGRQYTWKRQGFFRCRWQLLDQSEQTVFEMTRINKFFRNEASVQVSPFVANDPHVAKLIGLIWYLVQIERRRAAAAAAI